MTTTDTRLLPETVGDSALPGRHRDPISNRLRRAAGQLSGVQKMYEHGRPTGELLDHLAAARAALDAIALLIIDRQAEVCTDQAAADGNPHTVADLTDTVRRYLRSI